MSIEVEELESLEMLEFSDDADILSSVSELTDDSELLEFVQEAFREEVETIEKTLTHELQIIPNSMVKAKDIPRIRITKGKKRNYSASTTEEESNSTSSLYAHYKALPLDTPVRFAQAFTLAVNASDPAVLSDCFQQLFTPDVRILKHVYNVKNFQPKKKPLNHFGKYTTAEMNGEQYLQYNQAFALVSPDFTMDIGNHRVCYDKEFAIYMSMFSFNGTMITQDANLASTDKDGNVVDVKPADSDVIVSKSSVPYSAIGSMAMFRNSEGKIFRLEFYYEFTM